MKTILLPHNIYFLQRPMVFMIGLFLCFPVTSLFAQSRPKLVVGIVVDQMRYDLLLRYADKYGSGGFNLLLKQGYSFENTHYNYVPTYTGPGHASIYTGTTPAFHGIAANDWYDRKFRKSIYVTEDSTINGVSMPGKSGKMSPANLLSTTVTDELKLATHGKSKVIGIAMKDRGSILPAGHAADAAYWFDISTGNWGTSSFYMTTLPDWVVQFNAKKLAAQYLSQPWQTLYPIEKYTESTADDVKYEKPFSGETRPVFPHDLPTIMQRYATDKKYGLLRETPFGNTYTTDFAIEALMAEKLGNHEETDFLAVSYSSTDYVGHQFGPSSIEVEDTYLRLDLELARLLETIDEEVGLENTIVFLTADHGASLVPRLLMDYKMPGGYFDDITYVSTITNFLVQKYGSGNWILDASNLQLYLNSDLITSLGLKQAEIEYEIARKIETMEGVSFCITRSELIASHSINPALDKMLFGFHRQRSGDVMVLLRSGWLEKNYTFSGGTSHGSYQTYDTHVPNVWMGWNIPQGNSTTKTSITDIAPTLSNILGISLPSEAVGEILEFK